MSRPGARGLACHSTPSGWRRSGRPARILLNFQMAGPFAWFGGEPGQVGNEAAIVVQNQCRSQARHSFLLSEPGVLAPASCFPLRLADFPALLECGYTFPFPFDCHLPTSSMTYLVLARKWRPRSFDTLVGQDHVVRALTHALDTQRLHHAWLFTGTRGVGKTTLSRILAKSLNCEQGISARPCGQCRACVEIDAGRFVDYVELDAASNRGVEEMTQLLEQAVYAPGAGRFKVYMIDEVHMLSGHAFNAMLKTLEEPPPHVKFILATTDPQKIPATVLSRCLQFNLKQMTAESIISYLEMVLQQEHIQYDVPALRLLAQAASGSMRDALSLTDQAIAYSADNLTLEAIQGMLGTIDQGHLINLLRALGAGNASQVVGVADDLAMRGLSYSAALADVAVLLSRVAIEQRIAGSVSVDEPLHDDIKTLASELHPDVVQLFYSVAVHSRHELSLAPDEYAGFVMACLRMLSLVPPGTVVSPPPGTTTDDSTSESTSNNLTSNPEPQARPTNTAPVSSASVDAGPVADTSRSASPVDVSSPDGQIQP